MYAFATTGVKVFEGAALAVGDYASEGFTVSDNIGCTDFYITYTKGAETDVTVYITKYLPMENLWYPISSVQNYGSTSVLEKGFKLDPVTVVGATDYYLLSVPHLTFGQYMLQISVAGAAAGCDVTVVVKMEEK